MKRNKPVNCQYSVHLFAAFIFLFFSPFLGETLILSLTRKTKVQNRDKKAQSDLLIPTFATAVWLQLIFGVEIVLFTSNMKSKVVYFLF